MLNLQTGARKDWPKTPHCEYLFALGTHRDDAHLFGHELLMLVVASTPATPSLPSTLTVIGGRELDTELARPELLGGRVTAVQAAGMGLIVAVVSGLDRAHVMICDPGVSPETMTTLAAHAPANVTQLVADCRGRSIDVLLSQPMPGSTARRFRLFAGPNTQWEPSVVPFTADRIAGSIDALLSSEVTRYSGSPHCFVALGKSWTRAGAESSRVLTLCG